VSIATSEHREVSVERLVFKSVSRGTQGLSTGVGDLLTDGRLEETMQGASALNLDLLDPGYEALGSGLFGTRVVCTLDGVDFRFTSLKVPDTDRLSVVFEHRLVSEMREHTGPIRAQRGKVTRAEFILLMLRELRLPWTFICPELHVRQKSPHPEQRIENPEPASEPSGAATLPQAGRGAGLSGTGITVKGAKPNSSQLDILNKALAAAGGTGSSDLAQAALVVALIQENDVGWNNPGYSDGRGRGPLSIIDSTARGIQGASGSGLINVFDVAEISQHFLRSGFAGSGGANAIARAHPDWSATKIATAVEAPQVEYPHKWEAEARAIVAAYKGGASFTGGGSSSQPAATVATATFEFARGTPGQSEDTFVCGGRLAKEVQWSFFVCGPRSVYFVSDDALLKARPRYTIDPQTVGAGKLTFDIEVGARTVIINGKRQPKPGEAQLEAFLGRWEAPPGTVIELNGYGPADGRWLVDTVEHPLYSAKGVVHLRAPQHPLEEPQAQFTSAAHEGAAGTPPGGLVNAGAPFSRSDLVSWGRFDQGVDGVLKPGAPMVAMFDGVVKIAGPDPGGFGVAYAVLEGRDAFYYGHSVPAVPSGTKVKRGAVIAHANTHGQGNATTPGAFEIGKWPPGSMTAGTELEWIKKLVDGK
jgi:murein DD-endopeptidase MepM/ murein hydrolase activator NlpD